MQLSPEIEAALATAKDDARQRRHREVGPVHLLAALPPSAALDAHLPGAPYKNELRAQIDAYLGSIPPASGGYRSAAVIETTLSPALDAVLHQASHLFGILHATPDDVFKALREDDDAGPLIESSRLDLELFNVLDARVKKQVAERVIRPHHVVRVLGAARWFRRALATIGATPPAPLPPLLPLATELDGAIERSLSSARILDAPVTTESFLVHHIQHTRGKDLGLDLDPSDLVYAIVHDTPWTLATPPEGAELSVIVHESKYVEYDFVRDLVQRLGVPPTKAQKIERFTHAAGSAAAATLPRAEAIEFATLATDAARLRFYPLRLSFQAA